MQDLRIIVPCPRSEPRHPAVDVWSPTYWTTTDFHDLILFHEEFEFIEDFEFHEEFEFID